ncbi:flagellar biosynthesis repressor FlbT [Sphingomonas sp. HMP6]|uniref:flagellar biosynthesis repressor FlbT n=1 Tax=Sphingomonas sp. HMP6 TaxID=1517551 RepID=UPI001596DCC2|nr:flagellar biosynthesis repressor FlbT [Sphingomonas sp. HMP6]BCA58975.1 flagellar biosynthesis repressor FlbT [Sphingomonas sp. HMP6]
MTLRISLRDGEKLIVNGAVLRAIGRTDLCVENSVSLLRGREVMSPDDAVTPARRLYYACMIAYIDPHGATAHHDEIVRYLHDLLGALEAPEAKAACASFARKVATGDFYRALADCRALIDYEAAAIGRTAPQVAQAAA